MILKDMQTAFDYVEPAHKNLKCYSHRLHELLLRSCIEVEANFKAILGENGYSRARMSIKEDYSRVEPTHHLSTYEVRFPLWNGAGDVRSPFAAWATGQPLPWYQAYNTTKHDRQTEFEDATLEHVVDAVSGLLVLLSAQFYTFDFSAHDDVLIADGPNDGMETGIGSYLRVKFPTNWTPQEQYQFKWPNLVGLPSPFQQIDYTKVTPAQTV